MEDRKEQMDRTVRRGGGDTNGRKEQEETGRERGKVGTKNGRMKTIDGGRRK
jgi:hypothetical protein